MLTMLLYRYASFTTKSLDPHRHAFLSVWISLSSCWICPYCESTVARSAFFSRSRSQIVRTRVSFSAVSVSICARCVRSSTITRARSAFVERMSSLARAASEGAVMLVCVLNYLFIIKINHVWVFCVQHYVFLIFSFPKSYCFFQLCYVFFIQLNFSSAFSI